jgi:carboxyl-terminal processing protease
VYNNFLKRAITTENRNDFALLMQEFMALLNNTHTRYLDNELIKEKKPLGYDWINLNDQWIVTKSSIEELKKGDVIIKIDKKAASEYYEDFSKYINASSESSRKVMFSYMLSRFIPEKYSLEFMSENGKIKDMQIDRGELNVKKEVWKTEGRWIKGDRIAYIKIPSFGGPKFENDAIEYVKEFKNADVLIMDVRGNGGGTTPEQLIDILMDRPYRGQAESTPLSLGLFKFYIEFLPKALKQYKDTYKQEPPESWEKLLVFQDFFKNSHLLWKPDYNEAENTIYTNNMIILADINTASAAEDFVIPFKDNGRAIIMGEPTFGSTGQPYMYEFGDGISIGIGTKRVYMPDGSRFEGVGIQPDIEVKLTRKDLYKSRDRVLEIAVEEAEKLLINSDF